MPFFIDTSLGMMPFYSVGCYLGQSRVLYRKVNNNKIIIGALLVFICYVCAVILVKPHVNVRDNEYTWYLAVSALVPIFSLYILSKKISQSRSIFINIIKKCGFNSIFLFALHGPIYEVLFPIVYKVGLDAVFINLVILIITIPLCLMVGNLLLRHTPYLVGKIK